MYLGSFLSPGRFTYNEMPPLASRVLGSVFILDPSALPGFLWGGLLLPGLGEALLRLAGHVGLLVWEWLFLYHHPPSSAFHPKSLFVFGVFFRFLILGS